MKIYYSKSKIYKITNDYNDRVYIGSTCDTLSKCFSKHKSDINCKINPLHKLMIEFGFERFRIELICDYPCENKYQLRQKTGEYIRQYKKTLNLHGEDHKEERKIQKEQKMNEIQLKVKEELEKKIDKFKDKNSIISCNCDCEIIKRGLIPHQKIKHIDLMKNQNSLQTSN